MIALAVLVGAAGAGDQPAPAIALPVGLEMEYQLPAGTRITPAIVELGRQLFFDPRLSRDSNVSCASCHDPAHAFAGTGPTSEGVFGRRGTRNTPSIVNRLFGTSQFWDGRARTLEEQVLGPLYSPSEMDMDEASVESLLRTEAYAASFAEAFGVEVPGVSELTAALAAFERTLVSGASPLDLYEWNGDASAMSAEAVRGLRLFRGKARCTTCHTGFNLTDEQFHVLGAGDGADPGRFAVTGEEADRGAFKTPSLRNVALTAPYMHDGSLASLPDVIDFYAEGGGSASNKGPELLPLALTSAEKHELEEFLLSLNGPIVSLSPKELTDGREH